MQLDSTSRARRKPCGSLLLVDALGTIELEPEQSRSNQVSSEIKQCRFSIVLPRAEGPDASSAISTNVIDSCAFRIT